MEQKFEPLNPDDIADLEAKRTWARDHYDEAARHKYKTARHKYETLDGKLRLVDTILRNKWTHL
jgi:transcription elongation GreA/GreB family factor